MTTTTQTTTLSHIEFSLSELRSRYNQALGQKEMLEKQKAEKEEVLTQAKNDIELWQQVQVLFSKVSEYAREQLKVKIEETVTAALQAVFMDDTMNFQISINTVAGKPTAEWQVVSLYGDTVVTAKPEDAKGGGVTDVVSLALRLALLELARPKLAGPLLLDEPGKMISQEYLSNVAEFLKQYAAKTGRQIIMVTHAEPLADVADVSYKVNQVNGASGVSRIG